VARQSVGGDIDRPRRVSGWSCTADYYYDGPWSFLCVRRRSHGHVSIDRFRRVPERDRGCGVRRIPAAATLAA
jgi:hypothetical protein